ncbi:hypothetical protein [Limibacterium fermenti]|uniref:hypothetical protein n=1 Tax=Limibacterium fermenti TaxID=3229863 RepID=UPI003A68A033
MTEIFYQGDDIPVRIEIEEKEELLDIDSLEDLFVYFYTDGAILFKYSKIERKGYGMIHRNSATEYSCILDSEKTSALAAGKLWIEVNAAMRNEGEGEQINRLAKSCIGQLDVSLIKTESK